MKQERELKTVALMIELYCHAKHGRKKRELCSECAALMEYVKLRRSKCPFGAKKTFCSNCRIHCYEPGMRERIRTVMRYSGPRIVFRHPLIAIRHLAESKRQNKKLIKRGESND